MPENINPPENTKTTDKFNFNKFKISYIVIMLFVLFVWVIIFYNSKINSFKKDYSICSQTIISWDNIDTKIFDTRLSNLEGKYIDVLSSKETINFWLTFFTVFLTVSIWFFVYQKWKFEEKAESELNRVKELLNKAEEKIKNLDKNADEKIGEISEKAKEELIKISDEAENKLNAIIEVWEQKIDELNWVIHNWKDKIYEMDKKMSELNLLNNLNDNKKEESPFNNKMDLAIKYKNKWNYEEAIKIFDKLLIDNPNNNFILLLKGESLYKLWDNNWLDIIDNVIKDNPKYDYSYYIKANILLNEKKYDESLKCIDEWLINIRDYSWLYYLKSRSLFYKQNYIDAIKNIDKAINLNENNENYYYFKWSYLEKAWYIKEAIESYEKFIEFWKVEWYDYFNIWVLYSKLNNVSKSVEYLYRAFELWYFLENNNRIFIFLNDFDNIRESKEFKDFVEKLEQEYWKID